MGVQDWDVEVFKQYISWAKTFEVTMTPEAEKVLLAYYQHQRQMAMQDSSRTTTRMLQSLLRISQVCSYHRISSISGLNVLSCGQCCRSVLKCCYDLGRIITD